MGDIAFRASVEGAGIFLPGRAMSGSVFQTHPFPIVGESVSKVT